MGQWSAIALTCRQYDDLAAAYHHELHLWQKKGVFSQDTLIIVVEDPGPELGSGGATLNAILVIAEQLSASKGYSVLVADVVKNARILIIHAGRPYHQDPSGSAAFINLPDSAGWMTHNQCRVPLTPLLHTYLTISSLAEQSDTGPGLWVCGADSFLVLGKQAPIKLDDQSDIVLFSIAVDPDYAVGTHGVYRLDDKHSPKEVVYKGTRDQVLSCELSTNNQVALVLSLAYLKPSVAEALLHLQNRHPLNRCTYLGVDGGALSLQLSFFFDFVAASFTQITEEKFINGNLGSPHANAIDHSHKQSDLIDMIKARSLVWQSLTAFTSKVVMLPHRYYHYFLDDPVDLEKFMAGVAVTLKQLDGHYVMNAKYGNGGPTQFDHCNTMCIVNGSVGTVANALKAKRRHNFKIHCQIIRDVLMNNKHECLLPIFQNCCIDGYATELLVHLDQVAINCQSTSVIGRTLSCIADVLGCWAKGNGGLRSGPAQNAEWLDALKLLEIGKIDQGIQKMSSLRTRWSQRPDRLIRAARHYEAAAQIFTRRTVVESVKMYIQPLRDAEHKMASDQHGSKVSNVWHRAVAAARVDMAGGWSDTPPITYENGGAVLNIAIEIDGKKPIGSQCRRIPEPVIIITGLHYGTVESKTTLRTMDDIRCYTNPGATCALVCASLVCAEIVNPNDDQDTRSLDERLIQGWGGGFEITYWSDLPHGSGLGTSSILAGCLLMTIWKSVGVDVDLQSILNAVLYVEQLLTTGGGWQDQVGGLCPSVKIGRFESDCSWKRECGRPRLSYERVNLDHGQQQWWNEHLLLVYTGKTRLAKNLLQEVVRSWYARKQDIVTAIGSLVQNAEKAKLAFDTGDWSTVAKCAREYWQQKKLMVGGGGCEPERVTKLLKILSDRHLIDAGWLAGAGGGGFLYLISTNSNCKADIENVIMEDPEIGGDMSVHTVSIDNQPFVIDQIED